MVKHVLFVKLKDNSPDSCRELKDLFLSMKGPVSYTHLTLPTNSLV